MQFTKQRIYSLLETLPDAQLAEISNFIMYIVNRDENKLFEDLEALSASSTAFWDNEIDDEVWNNA